MARKLTDEEVRERFAKRGFLVTGKYEGSTKKIDCICPNGHHISVNFANFSRGHGCRKCRDVETGNRQRRTLESVREEFEKGGCTLLAEEYKNNQQPLRYICVCGRESEISLANFQRGARCYECGLNRMRGANNPRWNPDKKDGYRHSKEYKEWRRRVLSRDEYTCQKCGEFNWGIVAHHIFSFKTNEDIRYDLDNGISLCRKCHTKFHTQFGFNNNDWDQLMEFLTEIDRDHMEPWFAGEKEDDAGMY